MSDTIHVYTGSAPGFRPTHDGHPWRVLVGNHNARGIAGAFRHNGTFDHRADASLFGTALVDHLRPFFDWMAHP